MSAASEARVGGDEAVDPGESPMVLLVSFTEKNGVACCTLFNGTPTPIQRNVVGFKCTVAHRLTRQNSTAALLTGDNHSSEGRNKWMAALALSCQVSLQGQSRCMVWSAMGPMGQLLLEAQK